jgi:hypothetical protein
MTRDPLTSDAATFSARLPFYVASVGQGTTEPWKVTLVKVVDPSQPGAYDIPLLNSRL